MRQAPPRAFEPHKKSSECAHERTRRNEQKEHLTVAKKSRLLQLSAVDSVMIVHTSTMRSLLLLLIFGFINTVAAGGGACDRIQELPPECTCRDDAGRLSFEVGCVKTFNNEYFNDTIGMKMVVDLCSQPGSSVSIDVTETEHNIDFPITGISSGDQENIPIPGLSFIVPTVGHLGVDVAVLIAGNPDQLTLKVGLNACVALPSKELCAGSIPGLAAILPWWILSGTYSFGDVCNTTKATTEVQ